MWNTADKAAVELWRCLWRRICRRCLDSLWRRLWRRIHDNVLREFPERFRRGTPIVVLWPSNAYVQAALGDGSVNFCTVRFGVAFFQMVLSGCVLRVLSDTWSLRYRMFLCCVKKADWGMMLPPPENGANFPDFVPQFVGFLALVITDST